MSIRLPVRQPFDWEDLAAWLAGRAIPGVEAVDADGYERAFSIDGGAGRVQVTPTAGGVRLSVALDASAPQRTLGAVVGRVRRLLDSDADVDLIAAHLGADPLLAPSVAARPGLRAPGAFGGIEAGVRAIVGQQISVAGARTILGRIAERVSPGRFPEADELAGADLSGLGMVGQRIDAIHALAAADASEALPLDGSLPHAQLVPALCALPGIGPWTAEYIALRLGEPDAFPAGDLHLRRAAGHLSAKDTERRAESWRPWRAYAALHLWHLPATGAAA